MISPDEFYAFEELVENAFNALLKSAGFNAVPLFPESGILALPEDAVMATFELSETDESVLLFRIDPDDTTVSVPSGFSGTVEIKHCVPIDDIPSRNITGAPYPRLRKQRGRIRALCFNSQAKLQELLPCYDLLEIRQIAPRQRMDAQKLAHEATELFLVKFTGRPLDGLPR